jgi:dTDP-4-dehydrorhamnose 3,5-epimerase
MDGVKLTPLKRIPTGKGDVFHAMKASEESFNGFGEAYFSSINKDSIKGWKKHTRMILNLIVPVGEIEFICFNGESFYQIILSQKNYQRLTIEPGIWVAFRGLGQDLNLLLNIASIEHNPEEAINLALKEILYDW